MSIPVWLVTGAGSGVGRTLAVALAATVRHQLAGRPLAGIVHAAGVMAWDSPASSSGWSRVPQVNAVAPWKLTRALEASLLQAPGGRVLFIAGAPFTLRGRPDRCTGAGRGKPRSLPSIPGS